MNECGCSEVREGKVKDEGQSDMRNSSSQPLQKIARTSAFTLSKTGIHCMAFFRRGP